MSKKCPECGFAGSGEWKVNADLVVKELHLIDGEACLRRQRAAEKLELARAKEHISALTLANMTMARTQIDMIADLAAEKAKVAEIKERYKNGKAKT